MVDECIHKLVTIKKNQKWIVRMKWIKSMLDKSITMDDINFAIETLLRKYNVYIDYN